MKMAAESTTIGLRCGKQYFDLPPAERKPKALSHYPETLSTNTCDSWTEHLPSFRDSQRN